MLKSIIEPNFTIGVDKEGFVYIQNEYNKTFDILNNDKSVFRHLGFTKINYIGKKMYTGDEMPSIDKKHDTHLFIEGIVDNKPILSYGPDENPRNKCPIEIKFKKPLEVLQEIFIKFKTDIDPDSHNLVDFQEQPNELLFRIGCLETAKSK